ADRQRRAAWHRMAPRCPSASIPGGSSTDFATCHQTPGPHRPPWPATCVVLTHASATDRPIGSRPTRGVGATDALAIVLLTRGGASRSRCEAPRSAESRSGVGRTYGVLGDDVAGRLANVDVRSGS